MALEAGWLALLGVQVAAAVLATSCGRLLMRAVRRMPGNRHLELRVDFGSVLMFYLPRDMYIMVMCCFHLNAVLWAASLIADSARTLDFVFAGAGGCVPGFDLLEGFVCHVGKDSDVQGLGNGIVPGSLALVGGVCAPFALQGLRHSAALQVLAVGGLAAMSALWISVLVAEPGFPQRVPVLTRRQGPLIGTTVASFAVSGILPSWASEKRSDVSMTTALCAATGFAAAMYTIIGVVGGMAFGTAAAPAASPGAANLFRRLGVVPSVWGHASVVACPLLMNFATIPVICILIRRNLAQCGVHPLWAKFLAVAMPWATAALSCATGGFDELVDASAAGLSAILNFVVPVVVYRASARRSRGQNAARH